MFGQPQQMGNMFCQFISPVSHHQTCVRHLLLNRRLALGVSPLVSCPWCLALGISPLASCPRREQPFCSHVTKTALSFTRKINSPFAHTYQSTPYALHIKEGNRVFTLVTSFLQKIGGRAWCFCSHGSAKCSNL